MALESKFQREVIEDLRELFPGCIVLKNDANYMQGIPDLIILFENKWALLEVKRSSTEPRRPNQDYWVGIADEMSFAAFIFPENRMEILSALQQAFRTRRISRLPVG